ncbi:MAG TPA: hypothetical protein VLG76_08520 [Rhabdochlamydiaceae bacterium]|nr:hypothetical protein [Rhabdochlamydiaceae bacterium]
MNDIFIGVNQPIDCALWAEFMEKSASSNNNIESKPYICRKIYPDGNRCLSLMTPNETDRFFEQYGKWHANCRKMQFVDIIRISRIYLSLEVDQEKKTRVVEALRIMAAKAESKYDKDLWGTARKIFCWICNLFIFTRVITLFTEGTTISVGKLDNIPFFVGTDATFARLVADRYDNVGASRFREQTC